MKKKILLIGMCLLLFTGCTMNKLKKHLENIGFSCNRNSCEKSEEYNDITDDYYYSFGYTYSFDFDEKIFHIGYYKFERNDDSISSDTGSYGYTYNWETGNEIVKSVVDAETFNYNCNNREIDVLPLFQPRIDDNCNFLDQNGKYYQKFLVQCSALPTLCSEGKNKYYQFTN